MDLTDDGPPLPTNSQSRSRKGKQKQRETQSADVAPSPTPKRRRKEPAPPQEKRLARFRPQPSEKVRVRMDRALARNSGRAHRLLLIDHKPAAGSQAGGSDAAAHEFIVRGATGNVYTVTVGQRPRCTCPDFQRHFEPCKHALFVMLRVLKLDERNPLAWQVALLTSEVAELLAGVHSHADVVAGLQGDVVADATLRERYRREVGAGAGPGGAPPEARVVQRTDGDCCICFDALGASEGLEWCSAQCGNSFHASCFAEWRANKQGSGVPLTCPMCRALWPSARAGTAAASPQQYIALPLDEEGVPGSGGHSIPSRYQLYGSPVASRSSVFWRRQGGGGRRVGGRLGGAIDLTADDDA